LNLARILFRTWFTGLLYCLAGLGYLFYGFLLIVRLIQTTRILLALAGLVGVLAATAIYLLVPMQPPGAEMEMTVEPGMPVRAIARELKKNSVVPSATGLVAWIRLRGVEKHVQAGKYTFRRHEGIISAARKLLSAEPVYVVVTIPEGLIIEQTASRCAQALETDSAAFVDLCHSPAFIRSLGCEAPSLEGYLFPDTYRFNPQPSVEEVIGRLVGRFEEVWSALARTDVMERMGKHEIVTLSSIIEKEATLASERTHISGVFHNRLLRGYPLGADPTVRYALRKFSGPLRKSELENPSPYNTRNHIGLPPGPICSPGRGALEATVSPMQTKDLYFVARWDGSGAHDFSASNAEHERKKNEIRRMNEQRKRELAGGRR